MSAALAVLALLGLPPPAAAGESPALRALRRAVAAQGPALVRSEACLRLAGREERSTGAVRALRFELSVGGTEAWWERLEPEGGDSAAVVAGASPGVSWLQVGEQRRPDDGAARRLRRFLETRPELVLADALAGRVQLALEGTSREGGGRFTVVRASGAGGSERFLFFDARSGLLAIVRWGTPLAPRAGARRREEVRLLDYREWSPGVRWPSRIETRDLAEEDGVGTVRRLDRVAAIACEPGALAPVPSPAR